MLTDVNVTKVDDPVLQRHEIFGTKRMYKNVPAFWFQPPVLYGGPLRIKAHAHDKNASVNKFIRKERTDVVNQHDTWLKKKMKKKMKKKGKSW